jgi:hypothetical protein
MHQSRERVWSFYEVHTQVGIGLALVHAASGGEVWLSAHNHSFFSNNDADEPYP